MDKFSGVCIGGPLHSQLMHSRTPTFRAALNPNNEPFAYLEKELPTYMKIETFLYEYCNAGKGIHGFFFPPAWDKGDCIRGVLEYYGVLY